MPNPNIEEPHEDLKKIFLGQLLIIARLNGLTFINCYKKFHEVDLFLLPLKQSIGTTGRKQAELTQFLISKFLLGRELRVE
jgi:hypothetical protein